MYRDYSIHVHQYRALFDGIVYRCGVIGPYPVNTGLIGNYRPALATLLLKGRTNAQAC